MEKGTGSAISKKLMIHIRIDDPQSLEHRRRFNTFFYSKKFFTETAPLILSEAKSKVRTRDYQNKNKKYLSEANYHQPCFQFHKSTTIQSKD